MTAAIEKPFQVVDVFTDRRYGGNPLAVVLDADDLTGEQMATITREFNLSETAFVLTPAEGPADDRYRVRIFTPAAELPFAGHPSVGTAVTLARLGRIRTGEVIQECGAGPLPVVVDGDKATLTGGEPALGDEVDPAPLLAMAGLGADDLVDPRPRIAGAGLDHVFLRVTDDAVSRAELDVAAAREYRVEKVYVFAWDESARHAHARLFAPLLGVPEDPATGSAAVALGVWAAAAGLVAPDGTTGYTIAQGAEIGRPSSLACTVTTQAGRAVRTTVTGQVAAVSSGRIIAP